MQLGPYTTTEAVRACLGVDRSDCPDSVMTDSLLDIELDHELESFLPDHAARFATGAAAGAPAPEKRTSDLIRLFAQWFCAWEVASRKLLVPQLASDGKTRLDRFDMDLNEVASAAASRVSKYRGQLQASVGQPPAAAGFNLLEVSIPDADPVTEAIQ